MNHLQVFANPIGKKDNKSFMILSALGILFVVDEHLGRPISFLHQIFPYDSFYMPLFMFISGYFFHPKHCASIQSTIHFIWNKCKKSLFPYLFWIAFYGLFTCILRILGIIQFGKLTFSVLLQSILTTGTSFGYNDPSWFVPTLFAVSVIYCVIRTLLKRLWSDTISLIAFILIGAAAVYGANTEFNSVDHHMLLKITFFMQFYHLGFFFKEHIESAFDKINTYLLCAITICINIFLLSVYNYDIRFPYCARMGGFFTDNVFLPLITSATAIAFWLKMAKILTPVIGGSKVVNFISENTFFIMTHHLTAKALFNGLLILCKKYGLTIFSAVDAEQFKNTAWYTFSGLPWITTVCFIFTITVTLLACKAYLLTKWRCFAYAKSIASKLKRETGKKR